MIVIDIGCAKYGGDESIPYLIEEFDPDVLYGFDPSLSSDYQDELEAIYDRPRFHLVKGAAWVKGGSVGFVEAGLGGHVDHRGPLVPCFDLARFILELPEGEIILKIDAEGAEYELLPFLVKRDADLRLKLAWVEWHCESCRRGGGHREGCSVDQDWWLERRELVEGAMRCEMHEWNR